jgi:hypothetical protein
MEALESKEMVDLLVWIILASQMKITGSPNDIREYDILGIDTSWSVIMLVDLLNLLLVETPRRVFFMRMWRPPRYPLCCTVLTQTRNCI